MEAVLQGPSGRTVLGPAVLTIGRTSDNQLVVNDPKASSHHAEMRPSGQGYNIIDLGSTNGTFVNNQRLDRNVPRPLANGDRIRIGDTVFNYTATDVAPGSYGAPDSYSGYSPTVVAESFVEPSAGLSAGSSEFTGYGQGMQLPYAPPQQQPYMPPPQYSSAQQQYPPPPAYPPYPPPAAAAELPGRMQGTLPGGQVSPPIPTPSPPLQAVSPQPYPPPGAPVPAPYPPPTYPPDRVPSPKPGGRSRILLIVLAIIIVLGAGCFGFGIYHFLTLPQPVISVISKYHVGQTPAGSTSTTFHVSGQNFTANSAITFLLDGATAPGSVTAQSDAKGNVQADLTVTNGWIVGDHTLTARDANSNTTKSGIPVTIVPPGEASTPGPNGAPPNDMKFTINISIQATDTTTKKAFSPFSQTLVVTGQPDPAGGTVCQSRDNGQPQNIPGTINNSSTTYTEVIVYQCTGTYKGGQLSYTETTTSDKYTLSDGGICTANTPYVVERLTGTFTAPTAISGSYSSDSIRAPCTGSSSLSSLSSDPFTGNWSGQSS
jgi:hypothetical protein